MNLEKEGWVHIEGAKFWHFVDEKGRSLCRKWLYLGSVKPSFDKHSSPDNCKSCLKSLVARTLKEEHGVANPHVKAASEIIAAATKKVGANG